MKKRVFIVHGWGGNPDEGWFPWLKKELETRGFSVVIPILPDSNNPRIFNWVPALANEVGMPDEFTYFVGHSMGCQTIIRYIESLQEGQKIGGAVFVAGFLKDLTGLEDEEKEIGKHWMDTSIDLNKVSSCLLKSVAIFSDNDSFVPLSNADIFKEKLNSKIIIEHNKNHFSGSDGINELPCALKSVLEISDYGEL